MHTSKGIETENNERRISCMNKDLYIDAFNLW